MALELAFLSAIILALVEVVKRCGLPVKYAPLLAVVVGIVLSILTGLGGWGEIIINGIVAGLTAVGLFSGVKSTYKGFAKSKANV